MKIIRKDGVEYERKNRKVNYNTKITFKCEEELANDFKETANKNNIKYNAALRMLMKEYVERNK